MASGRIGEMSLIDLTAVLPEHSRVAFCPGSGEDIMWKLMYNEREARWCVRAQFEKLEVLYLHRFGTMQTSYTRSLLLDVLELLERDRSGFFHVRDDDDGEWKWSELSWVQWLYVRRPKMDVVLYHVDFVLPRHSTVRHEALRMIIPSVRIRSKERNSFWFSVNAQVPHYECFIIYARCSGELSNSVTPGTTPPSLPSIVKGANTSVDMDILPTSWEDSSKTTNEDGKDEHPFINVRCSVPDKLMTRMSEADYTVLYLTTTENFRENGDPTAQFPLDAVTDCSAGFLGISNVGLKLQLSPPRSTRGLLCLRVEMHMASFECLVVAGMDNTDDSCAVVRCCFRDTMLRFEWCIGPRCVALKLLSSLQTMEDVQQSLTVATVKSTADKNGCVSPSLQELVLNYERPILQPASITVSLPEIHTAVTADFVERLCMLVIPGRPYLSTTAPATLLPFPGRLLLATCEGVVVNFVAGGTNIRPIGLQAKVDLMLSFEWASSTRDISIFAKLQKTEVGFLTAADEGPALLPCEAIVSVQMPYSGSRPSVTVSADSMFFNLTDTRIPELLSIYKVLLDKAMNLLWTGTTLKTRTPTASTWDAKENSEETDGAQRMVVLLQKLDVHIQMKLSSLRLLYLTEANSSRRIPRVEVALKAINVTAVLPQLLRVELESSARAYNEDDGLWVQALDPWTATTTLAVGRHGSLGLVLTSDSRLDVTIAPATVRCLKHVVESVEMALKASNTRLKHSSSFELLPASRAKRQPTFIVRNETGRTLIVTFSRADGASSVRRVVAHGVEEEIHVSRLAMLRSVVAENNSSSSYSHVSTSAASIGFVLKLPGYEPVVLSTANMYSRIVALTPSSKSSMVDTPVSRAIKSMQSTTTTIHPPRNTTSVVWDVSIRGGLQVGTLRSLLRINNKSSIDLELLFDGDPLSSGIHLLRSGAFLSVPVAQVHDPIRVRPVLDAALHKFEGAVSEYQWSLEQIEFQQLVDTARDIWMEEEELLRREEREGPNSGFAIPRGRYATATEVPRLTCWPLKVK